MLASPSPSSQPASQPEIGVEKVVNFNPTTYHALEELAQASGRPIEDVLRDSIALSKWFNETIKSGNKILVERNGKLFEVIIK